MFPFVDTAVTESFRYRTVSNEDVPPGAANVELLIRGLDAQGGVVTGTTEKVSPGSVLKTDLQTGVTEVITEAQALSELGL